MRTDINVGMLIEGCNLHIGHVTEVDPQEDYVHFKSVFDGQTYNCSLNSCGVYELTTEEAQVRVRLYQQGGMEALSNFYFAGEDHVD